MKAPIAIAALAVAGAVGWAATLPLQSAGLVVTDAVAKPLDTGGTAAFLAIENSGAPDRLISVHSDQVAATLYSPADNAGAPVPTGAAQLALDGAHIRLDANSEDLGDGALIPLVLNFEKAGAVRVKARLSDPAQTGGAARAGLFGLGDICVVGEGEPAPHIELSVQETVQGWQVAVLAQEFTFSDAYLGLYHVPGMGHGHLYVGGMKLGRMLTPTAQIGALPSGRHEVRVTLNTNDHRAYVVDNQPVTATAIIVVP